jgi:hypothetical protein
LEYPITHIRFPLYVLVQLGTEFQIPTNRQPSMQETWVLSQIDSIEIINSEYQVVSGKAKRKEEMILVEEDGLKPFSEIVKDQETINKDFVKKEQSKFVTDILKSIQDTILSKIAENKIPQNWNGVQLRQYIADKVNEQVLYISMERKEKKIYDNDCLINGL